MLRTLIYLSALFSGLLIGGCANFDAVGKFAEGTRDLAEASGQFYDMTLTTDRQLALLNIDLSGIENSPECATKDGNYLTPWDCATETEGLMAEARRNRAAVQTLALYAQGLNQIATLDEDKAVENAAKDLSANLNKVASSLDATGSVDESALAKSITKIASIYLDLKASHVVQEKAVQAQTDVSLVLQTLIKDIQRQQKRVQMNRLVAKATREDWFNAFREEYQSANVSKAGQVALSVAAGHLVEAELNDKLAELPNQQFLENLERTAKSCLEAHIAIQNPELKNRAENITHFVNDAKNLVSSVKRIHP